MSDLSSGSAKLYYIRRFCISLRKVEALISHVQTIRGLVYSAPTGDSKCWHAVSQFAYPPDPLSRSSSQCMLMFTADLSGTMLLLIVVETWKLFQGTLLEDLVPVNKALVLEEVHGLVALSAAMYRA